MNTFPAIWLDGTPATALPLPDRGLDFGDGLFETVLLRGGTPLFSELHLRRLERGLAALGFPACRDLAAVHLETACSDIARRGWSWSSLRITVTRGTGPRGYAPPAGAVCPRFILTASPLGRNGSVVLPPAKLVRAAVRWPTQPLLAGIKHLNRLEQVLAAAAAAECGADEALMHDQQGRPVSVVAGNLFLVRGDRLVTPPLVACGVAGTRRQLVLEHWAPAIGLTTEERAFGTAELIRADEIFFTNSLVGLRPVASLQDSRWRAHDVCHALFNCYREAIR